MTQLPTTHLLFFSKFTSITGSNQPRLYLHLLRFQFTNFMTQSLCNFNNNNTKSN